MLGIRQAVRHRPLTAASTGSNPVSPAIIFDPLAQLVEHLTFNQGVPRSSRGWVTKKHRTIVYSIVQRYRADMAELADALDLGSSVLRREGSSPFIRTNLKTLLQMQQGFFHAK